MAGAVERLFGHMPTETRTQIAGVIRKEAFAYLGRRQSARWRGETSWESEDEDWNAVRRVVDQFEAVAKWIEDQ